jgi:MoaA/NifB/PqqE/SkfB family radical SAM enzyme
MMNNFEKKITTHLKCWNAGKKRGPLLITFRVTRGCDLKCRFCAPYEESVLDGELEFCHYEKILRDAHLLGVQYCAIVGGGEALYKKKLTIQIIDMAKQLGMTCWLVTNGYNFDENTIKHLVEIGFDTILFSIDGINPETHDSLRGVPGSFKRIISNIEIFNHWKARLHKKKPFLAAQTLIVKDNYSEALDVRMLVKRLEMREFIINYFVPQIPSDKKFLLSNSERMQVDKKIRGLLKQPFVQKATNFKNYLKIQDIIHDKYHAKPGTGLLSSYCFQPWYHLNVSEHGEVNSCPEWNRGERITVLDNSIEEIWFGTYMDNFRKEILNKNLIRFCQRHCNFSVALENIKISELVNHRAD